MGLVSQLEVLLVLTEMSEGFVRGSNFEQWLNIVKVRRSHVKYQAMQECFSLIR